MKSNPTGATRVVYAIGTVVGGGLFLYQVAIALTNIAGRDIVLRRPELIALGVVFVLLATLVQVAAWRTIMAALGASLTMRKSIRAYMLPFVARYIPGSVWGYMSRSQWMEAQHGTPPEITNLGAIVEAVSLISAASVVAMTVGLWQGNLFLVGASLVGGVLVVLGLMTARWLAQSRSGVIDRILSRFGGRTLLAGVQFKRVTVVLPWHLALWTGYGLVAWALVGSVADFRASDFATIAALYSLAWLAGFLVLFLPAGLGLREWGFAYLLSSSLGLQPENGSAVALMMRGQLLLAESVFILIALMFGTSANHSTETVLSSDHEIEPRGPQA